MIANTYLFLHVKGVVHRRKFCNNLDKDNTGVFGVTPYNGLNEETATGLG